MAAQLLSPMLVTKIVFSGQARCIQSQIDLLNFHFPLALVCIVLIYINSITSVYYGRL